MSYNHGVTSGERPTSVLAPVRIGAGLPVVIGTAPVSLAQAGEGKVNEPVVAYDYNEAVQKLGYSEEFDKFTICEAIKVFFKIYRVAPVVFINVLDPDTHKTSNTAESGTINSDDQYVTQVRYGILSTLVVKDSGGSTTYVLDTDYTATVNDDGFIVVNRIDGGDISAGGEIQVDYDSLDASAVTASDIVGGADGNGNNTGISCIEDVFPTLRLIPGQVLAPKFSTDPNVGIPLTTAAADINTLFKANALVDVPTDEVTVYSAVAAWKNDNSYTDPNIQVCWPKGKLGNEQYHLSTLYAAATCLIDSENDDIPYVSASNTDANINGLCLADGTEVKLSLPQANSLNGNGIITALNMFNGWVHWGKRTGAYPGNTDPKDSQIPQRRMFNWAQNELIATYWQRVDRPLNRRLIDTVVESYNNRLDGLQAVGALLGGRTTFVEASNPTTDLIDGIVKFDVALTPTGPAGEINFTVEYDPTYLQNLFAA